MRIYFLIFCAILVVFSCTSTEEKKGENTYQIISLLIDKTGGPIKPPPPPMGRKPYFTDLQIDSIMNRKQNIAIYPVFKSTKYSFPEKSKFGKEFNELIEKLSNQEEGKELNINELNIKEEHNLSFVDTIKLKSDKKYLHENYDKLMGFSNISFNSDFSKAVLIITSSRGYLSGSASLAFLEKINDVWFIKGFDTFSIS